MKSAIRIKGLVRFADALRRQLALPTDRARLTLWRGKTRETLKTVGAILRRHGLRAIDLPAPSRRAYEYLKAVDFGSVRAAPTRTATRPAARPPIEARPKLRFPGLMRDLDRVLEQLNHPRPLNRQEVARGIADISHSLEQAIADREATPQQLSDRTRAARAWFAWFADPEHVAQYAHAVLLCHLAFTDATRAAGLEFAGLAVEFRPVSGLYRLRQEAAGRFRLRLPIAMITFDRATFDELCRHALSLSRQRRKVMDAIGTPAFQRLRDDLEALGGVSDEARGRVYDLRASLDRVARQFFDAGIEAPRLCWSRRRTRRKLGHYDPLGDTIMISATLDSVEVPRQALDFVMYHELLHKQHGTDWRGDRAHVHTAEFRRDEQRFPDMARIEALLAGLCR